MGAPRHRIHMATLVVGAPRGAPDRQAAADRLARHLRQALAPALSRALGNHGAHVVIERLACRPVRLCDGSPQGAVEAIAARIARDIRARGSAPGVHVFASEAAYVAAFVAERHRGDPARRGVWAGLSPHGRADPLQTALAAASARALPLQAVLREIEYRMPLRQLFDRAPRDAVAAATEALLAGTTDPSCGAEALAAVAAGLLRAAGRAAGDPARRCTAVLAGPVDWRDPASLADAVARAVRAEAGPGGRDTRGPGAGVPLEPRVAQAIARLSWLDRDRLRARLSGLDRTLPPPAAVERGCTALTRALAAVVADLAPQRPNAVPRSDPPISTDALQALWLMRLTIDGPPPAPEAVMLDLLRRVVAGTEPPAGVPGWPQLTRLWARACRLTAREPAPASALPAAAPPRAAGPGMPRPDPRQIRAARAGAAEPGPPKAPAGPQTDGAILQPEGLAPVAPGGPAHRNRAAGHARPHEPTRPPRSRPPAGAGRPRPAPGNPTGAAGLFLLWRSLGDLHFDAALKAEHLAEARNRALWTLALAICDLPASEAARDAGVRLFCGLEPADDPAALSPEADASLTRRLRRAPALRARTTLPATLSDTVTAAFAAWLRGFEASRPAYIARTFLHRRGLLRAEPDRLYVTLAPLPHDLILRRAGYLDPFDPPPGTAAPRLHFSIGVAP